MKKREKNHPLYTVAKFLDIEISSSLDNKTWHPIGVFVFMRAKGSEYVTCSYKDTEKEALDNLLEKCKSIFFLGWTVDVSRQTHKT